ncbi:MAG: LysM peptidoglycan-binding domain-containing protein [Chloroflexota bacterium]
MRESNQGLHGLIIVVVSLLLAIGSIIFVPPTSMPQKTPTAIYCGKPNEWVTYKIQEEDSLLSLSKIYGVTVTDLLQANCLDESELLLIGNDLYVPFNNTTSPSATFTPIVINKPSSTSSP